MILYPYGAKTLAVMDSYNDNQHKHRVIMQFYHFAECHYDKDCFAECHYAECRGTRLTKSYTLSTLAGGGKPLYPVWNCFKLN